MVLVLQAFDVPAAVRAVEKGTDAKLLLEWGGLAHVE